MGARPRGFTCALAAPGDLPLARRSTGSLRGLLDGARRHACPLVGGNLTRARETSLVLTVFGGVAPGRALRRRARAGDRILVTGELGAAALARARAERSGTAAARGSRCRGCAQGRALARIAAVTGCIDVSDGLAADLGAPARAAAPLPRSTPPGSRCRAASRRRAGGSGSTRPRSPLAGGDDYELLFALRPDGPSAAALARRLGVRVSELGRVERGRAASAARAGFEHFARDGPVTCT